MAKRRTRKNPIRKGKIRAYDGRKRPGTVFKAKGRYRIVMRLRNGVKVSRPWKRSGKR